MIYFFTLQTVTLAQMASLNDEPRVFSTIVHHCENLSAVVSLIFFVVVVILCIQENMRKYLERSLHFGT